MNKHLKWCEQEYIKSLRIDAAACRAFKFAGDIGKIYTCAGDTLREYTDLPTMLVELSLNNEALSWLRLSNKIFEEHFPNDDV